MRGGAPLLGSSSSSSSSIFFFYEIFRRRRENERKREERTFLGTRSTNAHMNANGGGKGSSSLEGEGGGWEGGGRRILGGEWPQKWGAVSPGGGGGRGFKLRE